MAGVNVADGSSVNKCGTQLSFRQTIPLCRAAQVAWPGSSIQSWIDRGTMAAVNRGFARVAGARLSGASIAKQSFVPSMLRPLRGIPFNSVIWWQGCAHSVDIHMLW